VIVQKRSVTPDRRLFAPGWLVLAGGGGAQIIYSAATGRDAAAHAGAVSSPLNVRGNCT